MLTVAVLGKSTACVTGQLPTADSSAHRARRLHAGFTSKPFAKVTSNRCVTETHQHVIAVSPNLLPFLRALEAHGEVAAAGLQDQDVVFFETAVRLDDARSHAVIEAVPLPAKAFSKAPLYFKKALPPPPPPTPPHPPS